MGCMSGFVIRARALAPRDPDLIEALGDVLYVERMLAPETCSALLSNDQYVTARGGRSGGKNRARVTQIVEAHSRLSPSSWPA